MTEDSQSNDEKRAGAYGTLAEGGQFYRRPGARLTEPQDASVIRLSSGSSEMHSGFHSFDKAHLVMLAEEGLIPNDSATTALEAFREIEKEGLSEVRRASGHGAHAGEAYLIAKFGEEAGGYIHLGRSSHDLVATAVRVVARERLLTLCEALVDLIEAYVETAERYSDAVIPTYTGYQHAQVGTVGYSLLAWERPLERDLDRLLELYERINRSPAGAAVGTTTDFPISRERTAELLGFDSVLDNAEGVDKNFDLALEAGGVLGALMANLGYAADQLLIWYSSEFNLIDMPDRFCGTSSIMPQKKNPHSIQSVQRDTNGVIGEIMNLYLGAKNIGGGCRFPLSGFDTAISATETWSALIPNLEVDRERGRELVFDDWAFGTDIASLIVREADLPWRIAHQITAVLVRQAAADGIRADDLEPSHIVVAAEEYLGEPLEITERALEDVLNPERALAARADVHGSPAPNQISDQITHSRRVINEKRQTIEGHQQALSAAEERLEAAINEVIAAN
jgi:argininosuccinate lyase